MKYLLHIFLPPVLVGLFGAAVVVPKYYRDDLAGIAAIPAANRESLSSGERSGPGDASNQVELIAPFLSSLETGDLAGAEAELEELHPKLSPDLITGLRVALISTRGAAKALQEREIELLAKIQSQKEQKETALAEANRIGESYQRIEEEFSNFRHVYDTEISALRSTLSELLKENQVTAENEEKKALEISRLFEVTSPEEKANPEDLPGEEGSVPPVEVDLPSWDASLKIPAPLSVHFEGDSIEIPDSVSMYVDQMGEWLNEDQRLGIRLRGRLQAGDDSPAQRSLAMARSRRVEETLIKNGASKEQINIVALESVESTESETDAFGYVELIFFKR